MGEWCQALDPIQRPVRIKHGYFMSKPVYSWLACGFLSLALVHFICCSSAGTQQAVLSPLLQYINSTYSVVLSVPGSGGGGRSCNYSEGQWVFAPGHARRYNGTLCNVKESHDCVRNGRPDTGYLDWRWQPAAGCPLPAFDARSFLSAVRGKHVAFIGDSMARNQAQSLVCLLSAEFAYRLLDRDRDDDDDPRKHSFWRYAFPAHDVTVSFYWYPFLVRATGKAEDELLCYNHVHLDEPGERWAADADAIDVAVLSASHWLLNGGVYYNGSEVVGAHNVPELNHTGAGNAWPMRVVHRTVIDRLSVGRRLPRTVVLATFSPSHFESESIYSPAACARKEPYKARERELGWVDKEVRDIVYDEAEAAKARIEGEDGAVRIEVLDVTKLAAMRPDGHPGPYMHRDPFAHGAPEKVGSDCLHFCLPGPVDTFNEILLQVLRKRR